MTIGARPARLEDAQSIARIEVETWRTAYAGTLADDFLLGMSVTRRASRWAAQVRSDRGVWVWEDEADGVLGFGHCGRQRGAPSNYDGEIYMLYVLPDAQDRGVGRQLLLAMFESLRGAGCRSALVWVVRTNPARFFYERMGAALVLQQKMQVGGRSVEVLGYGWSDLGCALDRGKRMAAR